MALVTLRHKDGTVRSGILEGERIRLLRQTGGDDALAYITSGGDRPGFADEEVTRAGCTLLAPLLHPPRIFAIGLNYAEHAAESKMKVQDVPTVFLKLPSSITGPETEVLLPPEGKDPDFEAEMAVVIGRGGYRIRAEDWKEHVFGYTIINDVSARGVQLATSQWSLAKSLPTFTPMGPWIALRDEIADPHALGIRLTLAGEVMQQSNTSDLIFKVPQLIEYISSLVPLEPGDVISTGTPSGVGLGRTPKRWLRDGEEMVVEVEGIGALRNRTRVTG